MKLITLIASLIFSINSYCSWTTAMDDHHNGKYVEAFQELKRISYKGEIRVQNKLADMYRAGEGTSKNSKKAIEWYKKSADKNNSYAYKKLAKIYEYGGNKGVSKDHVKSIYWYKKAGNKSYANKLKKHLTSKQLKELEALERKSMPQNAHASGNSWTCNTDYYKTGSRCSKVPANAYSTSTINYFLCKTGYTRSGNSCVRKNTTLFIPQNAHASGNSWTCNTDYYKTGSRCSKVPANSYSKYSSNYFTCKAGYKISGNSCVKKTTSSDDNSNKWIYLFLAFIAFLLYKSNSYNKAGTYRITNHETVAQRAAKKKAEAAMSVKKKEWQKQADERQRKRAEKEKRKTLKTMPKEKAEAEMAAMKKAEAERAAKKKAEDEMAAKKKEWQKQADERQRKRAEKEKRKSSITKSKSKSKSKFEQHFAPGSTKGFKIIDFEQGSKNWLKWRHEGIGASNAPTIMGDNRFQTPDELLYLKKNKIDTVPNKQMKLGIKLEPEARKLYIEKTGIIVKPQCVQDNKYPWLIASMDGISNDLKHIIEIKCGKSAYWQARKGIVPEYYYGQLQHTMMITRLSQIDYWCYWPGQRSILQTVERDDEYIKILFKAEQAFQKKLES